MATFPRIQSPCPYRNEFVAIMDGAMCRLCKRQVFDLTAMSDEARIAFLSGCSDEVCVSYRLKPTIAAAAIAAAAAMMPSAALAEDEDMMIIVGGIKDPRATEMVTVDDTSLPALPVVYEDEESGAPSSYGAKPAQALSSPRGS